MNIVPSCQGCMAVHCIDRQPDAPCCNSGHVKSKGMRVNELWRLKLKGAILKAYSSFSAAFRKA